MRIASRSMWTRWIFLMVIGVTALAAVATSGAAEKSSDQVLNEIGFDQHLGAALPLGLPFRNEAGETVPLRTFFTNRPVVLVPVYYDCPMLCTLTLNGLLRALRALRFSAGNEFQVVVFSINPAETPALAQAKKASYVEGYSRPGGADGWHFLTGSEDSIHALTAAMGFRYVPDSKTGQFAHASGFVVATPNGSISRYFFGAEPSAKELRVALLEASGGKIGSLVDQVLLYCYHYDPQTGRYSLAILRLVRCMGIATVLLMAFGFFYLNRLARRA